MNTPIKAPIILALDDTNFDKIFDLANQLSPYIAYFKLGLEFYSKFGPDGISKFTNAKLPIFLDLKLHDIPNTIAKSVSELCKLNISMLTIHISGGKKMLEAAINARNEIDKNVMLLGVTILTSLDNQDIESIGFKNNLNQQVINLFKIANNVKLDGVVSSAAEVTELSKINNNNLKFITPGIRLEKEILSKNISDQKRVITPKQAILNGSNYLVIGRTITNSNDPINMCKKIADDITNI